jgi:hypothetical protein
LPAPRSCVFAHAGGGAVFRALARAAPELSRYNPDQPRVPAGQNREHISVLLKTHAPFIATERLSSYLIKP